MRGTDCRRWVRHREPSEEAVTMVQIRVGKTRGLEEERAVEGQWEVLGKQS